MPCYDRWAAFRDEAAPTVCLSLLRMAAEWQPGPMHGSESVWHGEFGSFGWTRHLFQQREREESHRTQIWISFGKPYSVLVLEEFWILHAAAGIYVIWAWFCSQRNQSNVSFASACVCVCACVYVCCFMVCLREKGGGDLCVWNVKYKKTHLLIMTTNWSPNYYELGVQETQQSNTANTVK